MIKYLASGLLAPLSEVLSMWARVSPAPASDEHFLFGWLARSCLSESLASLSGFVQMTTKAWSDSFAWWRQDTASPCVFPSRLVPFMDKMLSPLWIVPSWLAAPLAKTRWTWTQRVLFKFNSYCPENIYTHHYSSDILISLKWSIIKTCSTLGNPEGTVGLTVGTFSQHCLTCVMSQREREKREKEKRRERQREERVRGELKEELPDLLLSRERWTSRTSRTRKDQRQDTRNNRKRRPILLAEY